MVELISVHQGLSVLDFRQRCQIHFKAVTKEFVTIETSVQDTTTDLCNRQSYSGCKHEDNDTNVMIAETT